MSSITAGSRPVCFRKIEVGLSSHQMAIDPSRDALCPENSENMRHESRKSYGLSQMILMMGLYQPEMSGVWFALRVLFRPEPWGNGLAPLTRSAPTDPVVLGLGGAQTNAFPEYS